MSNFFRSKPNDLSSYNGISLRTLLSTNKHIIDSLKKAASEFLPSDEEEAKVIVPNDVFYLRYALDPSYKNNEDRITSIKSTIRWRMNEGRNIVTSAHNSLKSVSGFGRYDTEPVRKAAPHSEIVTKFLTPTNYITTTIPSTNDIICVVRVESVDSDEVMNSISLEQLVESLLYFREVNNRMANARSLHYDKLISVISVNEFSKASILRGKLMREVQNASITAAKKGNELYPFLCKKVLVLNIPKPIVLFYKLISHLLPAKTTNKISIEYGPLRGIKLEEILDGGEHREEFVRQIEGLVYV